MVKMRTLYMSVLLIFLLGFALCSTFGAKNQSSTHFDHENILDKDGAKYEKLPQSKFLHMSYIAKPALVRILCRSVIPGFYDMKISCPTLDGDRDNTITPFLNKSIRTQHVKRTIHPKATTHRTHFRCFCHGRHAAYSTILNASIMIEVQKPRNKVIRRKTDAKKSIQLKCDLTGSPPPYVSWYKSGRKMSLRHDGRKRIDGIKYKVKKHNLQFKIADTRASGIYTCSARNMAGHERGKRYDVTLFNDDDGCLSHTCRSNATCTRNNGTFSCLCKSGFIGNEVHCTDINECLSNPCRRNEICVNEISSFSCKTKNKTGNSSKHKDKKEYMWIGLGVGIVLLVLILSMIWWKCKKPKNRRESIMDSDNSLRDSSVFQDNNPTANSTPESPPFNLNATIPPVMWSQYLAGPGIRCSHSEPHLSRNDSAFTFSGNDQALFNLEHRAIMPTSSCSTDISSTVTTPFAAVLPKNANERHYSTATIDHRGRELILNNAGAKLIIPQGALPNDVTEDIYITLMENDNDRPHLEPHLSLISPVIMCGPHGLKFEKPVMLIFPHCAAIQKGICGFQILCSNTNEYQDTKWETIFDADKNPSEDCFCSYDDNMCYLSILHFTKFAAVCRCKAKMMNFLAYTTKSNIPDDFCQIRTYCFPNSEVCRKKIQDDEYSVHGTRCDAVRSLLLMENGKGFQYTIKDIEEGWKNLYEASQTIDHVEIWNSMFPVSRTFTLKRTDSKSKKKKFSCRIEVMQKDGEEAKIRTIHVAHHLDMSRTSSSSSSSGASSSGYDTSRSGEETRGSSFKESCRFPTELRVKLARMLDGERMVDGKDWRLVAEKLEVGNEYIKWLTRNKRIDSPTIYVLRFYENIPNSGSTETKLRKLAKILDEIEREDASRPIKDYLEKKSPQRKETTTEPELKYC